MKKLGICIVVGLISMFLVTPFSYACVGARPMAMGGAFVGVADDANATYWNPGGLGFIDAPEITYTPTIYDRDSINYDDWLSFVYPLSEVAEVDAGAFGFAFMNNIDKLKAEYDTVLTIEAEVTDQWYMISYGREIFKNLSLGINLRFATYEAKLKAQATIGGVTYAAEADDSDDALELDLAAYYVWERLSLGLLLQNANEPEITLFGAKIKYNLNLRPGIAYRPDDKTILSFELYDVTDESNAFDYRLGLERWLTDNVILRVGGYNLSNAVRYARAITAGLGLNFGEMFEDFDVELQYTLMYWPDIPTPYTDTTHFLGISVKF